MQMLITWFGEQSHLISFMQILLDLALIAVVVIFIKGRRKTTVDGEGVSQSLDKIIAETKTIAQQLDGNLQERQRLIQQVVTKLDQKLEEAKEMCQKLDSLNREFQAASFTQAIPHRHQNHQEIIRLARMGMDAGAIAERLQKPLGEVELVLSLKRLSPER